MNLCFVTSLFLASALLLFLIPVIQGESYECPLDCHHEAPCVLGSANFSDHPTYSNGSPLPFHSVPHKEGMHCACPHGWTGLTCSHIFESCDGDHICYNGGSCIPGLTDIYSNEQLFCDCSGAVDELGNVYVGKFCEHLSTDPCDFDGSFCVNGGKCNVLYPEQGSLCDCPSGFKGIHCEFEEITVPDCNLDCQNLGVCALGSPRMTFISQDLEHLYRPDTKDQESMYCLCPESFAGRLCDIEIEQCGTDRCYHGGTCVKTYHEDGEDYSCDCSTAATETKSYAGRHCQFASTSFCSEIGKLFCVNDGECPEAGKTGGCICKDDYFGLRCEYQRHEEDPTPVESPVSIVITLSPEQNDINTDPPSLASMGDNFFTGDDYVLYPDISCDLECENQGICTKGIKKFGVISHIAPHVEELNHTSDGKLQYCICPMGFLGVRCEHEIDICSQADHFCLFGSKCALNGGLTTCNCSASESYSLVGPSCEHKNFVSCNEDSMTVAQGQSFCVNGGVCKAFVSGGMDHPGCDCDDDNWYGPHCELRNGVVNTLPENPSSGIKVTNEYSGQSAFLAVGILSLTTSCLVSWYTHKRNKAAEENLATKQNLAHQPGIQRQYSINSDCSSLASSRTTNPTEMHEVELI